MPSKSQSENAVCRCRCPEKPSRSPWPSPMEVLRTSLGTILGSAGGGAETARQAGARGHDSCVLRGRTDRLYAVLAVSTALGDAQCDVIAPSLDSAGSHRGDRVKTDSQDAARYNALLPGRRSHGGLGAGRRDRAVPRSRPGAGVTKQGPTPRSPSRGRCLLRHGRQRPGGMSTWTLKHAQWLVQQRFALATLQVVYDEYRATLGVLADRVARLDRAIHTALATLAPTQQALVGALATLRGVKEVTAATLVCRAVGTLRRFGTARQVMGYAGLVPASTRAGAGSTAARLRKLGTRISGGCWSKPPGPTDTARIRREASFARANTINRLPWWRSPRKPSFDCVRATAGSSSGSRLLAVAAVIARVLLGFVWAIGQLV